ncbi:MFS transporter [Xylophilus sp. ASV27]|uniref:MFS transporter n=1 Tax=Xylophilus sp. ASV27 TaxID=2795129 RepID=UPI0018ED66EC|nr:MFS transporter [Xylophilus sp. ASV27]
MNAQTLPLRPLMAAYMACTMAMMAFVAVVGPMARILKLPPWQAGAVITIGGILWMLLSRAWGAASDRRGRRAVLLTGVGGFMLSYWAMCALLIVALRVLPAAWQVFVGLVVTRGAVGAFYAAIPSVGQALVADHLAPGERAGAMASLGAANALGLVLGPALAAGLTPFGLSLPLYVTAVLPAAALAVLWAALPRTGPVAGAQASSVGLTDRRLRRSMAVAFAAMFCVAIAQITVGFFALDRLNLAPAAAARVAGLALTMVGVGLVAAQLAVRRLGWSTQRLIRAGAWVSALGFGSVALASQSWMLVVSYFVAAAGMGWVFPAFAAMASNAVQAHEQGAAAGSIGAAQGLGIVLGPLAGTLLYEAGPGVPYVLAGGLLVLVALWPERSPVVAQPSPG